MEKLNFKLDTPFIRLDHLLKLTGLAGSCGEAGQAILQGMAFVNAVKATEKRKKIYLTDKVVFNKQYIILLQAVSL